MNTDLTGRLLIALPSIGDPLFSRSVILLCAHSPDFAMGIVLNKPMTGIRLPELFEQLDVTTELGAPDTCVLDGGPVSTERGFVIHTDDVISEGATLEIDGGIRSRILGDCGRAPRRANPCWRSAIPAGGPASLRWNWRLTPGW